MARINIVNADNKIESNPRRAYFKLKNTGGPKGDTGAQGPQGPKGDTGAQGPAGLSASVTVGSTTTLAPGASATVTNSGDTRNAVLNFGIPTGAQGPQGVQGPKGDTGPEGAKGAKGDTGAAATVTVANTNTGAPGTNASVENVGDEHNAVLNFTIPRGDKGETGAQGPEGPAGQDGKDFTPTVVTALPETGENGVLYMTEKAHATQTATGNPITATITDGAGKMEAFQLDGDTFQQSYTGKNLFNAQGNYIVGLINGNTGAITEDSTDTTVTTGIGSIKVVNSHPSGNFRGYISGKIVLQVGSYTLSFTRAETTGHYAAVFTYDSDDNFLGRVITLSGQVTSGNGDISNQVAYVRIVFETNTHGTTVTFDDIQLEAGSTATDYEPYCGGQPSPNPEYPQPVQTVTGTQTVEILGKNRIGTTNNTVSRSGLTATVDGDIITIDGTATGLVNLCSARYNLAGMGGTRPAISVIPISGSWTGGSVGFSIRDSSNSQLFFQQEKFDGAAFNANTLTESAVENADHAYIFAGATTVFSNFKFRIMMTSSDTIETDFVPYSDQFLPLDLGTIELCKLGDSQDSIYYDGANWTLEKQTITRQFNGNDTDINRQGWFNSSDTNATTQVVAISCRSALDGKFSEEDKSLMTHFYHVGGNLSPVSNGMFKTVTGTGYPDSIVYIRLGISKTIAPDVDSAKAWIAANKPTIYMPKLTPTKTTITDAGLIAQLEAIRTALLEKGANTITNTAAGSNLAGDMEIGYYGYTPTSQYDKWLWLDVGAAGAHYEQI